MRRLQGAMQGLRPGTTGLLIGLAAGWQWAGMERMLASLFGPVPDVTAMLAVIALLAAAAGPWIPERAASWVARLQARRRPSPAGGEQDERGWILRALRARDMSLMWLLVALLACTGGFFGLLMPSLLDLFARGYAGLLERFFWTRLTLTALQWFSTALLTGPAWMILGVLTVLLAALEGGRGETRNPAASMVAGLLLGLGLACATAGPLRRAELSGDQVLLVGLLPAFLLAALAAFRSQRLEAQPAARRFASPCPPELHPRGEGWVWLAGVIVGIGATAALTGRAEAEPPAGPGDLAVESAGWSLVLAGLAATAAARQLLDSRRSAAGCGMAVWAAGAGAGIGAVLAAYRPHSSGTMIAIPAALGLPAGYALAYVFHAWTARTGGRVPGFAQLFSAVLGGAAIGLIAGSWLLLRRLGPIGTMSAAALLLLAFGGLAQIHEPLRPARVRHLRLSLVFAALAAALVFFPAAARRWAQSAAPNPAPAPPAELCAALQSQVPAAGRFCVIAPTPETARALAAVLPPRAEILAAAREDGPVRAASPARSPMQWFPDLRISPDRYDAIVYLPPPLARTRSGADYSIEALRLLAGRLKPGGRLVMPLPPQAVTKRQFDAIVATFREVFVDARRLSFMAPGGDGGLILVSRPPDELSPAGSGPSLEYRRLDPPADGAIPRRPAVHSVRRERLSARGGDASGLRIGPEAALPGGQGP